MITNRDDILSAIKAYMSQINLRHRTTTVENRKTTKQWCSGKYLFGGMNGERGRERITGVWGQSPQRGPGAEPLVGVRGAKPP